MPLVSFFKFITQQPLLISYLMDLLVYLTVLLCLISCVINYK